jgi:hypothetical protein
MKHILAALALAAALPVAAEAQRDVTRRAYTFLEDRLVVAVHAEAPGELQVVRGQRGRIEVAARSSDGFAGFGLGGYLTRRLSLTAVGSDAVQYLVVVPEHVHVSVILPHGGSADVPYGDGIESYSWGLDGSVTESQAYDDTPIVPSLTGGLYVVHSGHGRSPGLVDIPDLSSIRSISVRVEGDDFQVAATRPLALTRGSEDHMLIRVEGSPLDLVFFVPRNAPAFQLRSGSQRLADVTGGRPRSYCGSTVLQQPGASQDWLTLFPADGLLRCR